MALRFAREGARVAFTWSRHDADAEEAAALIGRAGSQPLMFKGSVADAAHVDKTVRAVNDAWGGIDVLVNNAGTNQVLPLALLEEADWDAMMAVNVKGPYLFSRAVLRGMIRERSGAVLNIGAFTSERVVEASVHFAAAKSALRGFTEALAREVGRYNIRVNLLAPGLMDAGLGRMLPQHRIKGYISQAALGRVGTTEEMAEAALFLVSPGSGFISGAKLAMDGGL